MKVEKCYSLNGEEFNTLELADLFTEMDDNGDLIEGAEYWEADADTPDAAKFFDAEQIIEFAAERAYEEGGDYAEDFGDVSKEAVAELDAFLTQWANKHCTVRFYTVSNVKNTTVTADDVAEYASNGEVVRDE